MERFEPERLIGDVCRSINQLSNGATQHQLLNLCDRCKPPKNTETASWTCPEPQLPAAVRTNAA
jgi:hypothetical protein